MVASLPRRTYCLHLKPWKIKGAGSSKRLATIYQTRQHHISSEKGAIQTQV
jgi:hypothetical protein